MFVLKTYNDGETDNGKSLSDIKRSYFLQILLIFNPNDKFDVIFNERFDDVPLNAGKNLSNVIVRNDPIHFEGQPKTTVIEISLGLYPA